MPQSLSELLSEFRDRIKDAIRTCPDLTYRGIAQRFGVSVITVKRLARKAGVKRRRGPRPTRPAEIATPTTNSVCAEDRSTHEGK